MRTLIHAPTSGRALEAVAWAGRLGGPVEVVWGGNPPAEVVDLLGGAGVSVIHVAAGADAVSVAGALAETATGAILAVASTRTGRDVAGILAARLGAAVVGGVTDAGVAEDGALVTCAALGGSVEVRVRVTGGPLVLLLPERCSAAPAGPGSRPAAPPKLRRAPVPAGVRRPEVRSRQALAPAPGPPLGDARVVIAGGAGLGDAATFGLVGEVAELLGGAVGASRAAVDAGWAPPGALVGQSGTVIAPEVYLAAGISGASQHAAGIGQARHIVAVGRDPGSPMLRMADLGIVGDAGTVLRQLCDELRRRRGG